MLNTHSSLKAFTLTVLLTCLTAGSALAQRPGGVGGPPAGGGGRPTGAGSFITQLANILELSDAQQAQIKAIQDRADAAAQPYEDRLKPLFEQAHALVEADVFNENALRALYTQISPLELELHVIQARAQSDTYNVLTAEQKAKLADIRKMMQQNGGGRPGGNGGGRPFGGGRP
mgnify:CR=1 FL=1